MRPAADLPLVEYWTPSQKLAWAEQQRDLQAKALMRETLEGTETRTVFDDPELRILAEARVAAARIPDHRRPGGAHPHRSHGHVVPILSHVRGRVPDDHPLLSRWLRVFSGKR